MWKPEMQFTCLYLSTQEAATFSLWFCGKKLQDEGVGEQWGEGTSNNKK